MIGSDVYWRLGGEFLNKAGTLLLTYLGEAIIYTQPPRSCFPSPQIRPANYLGELKECYDHEIVKESCEEGFKAHQIRNE